MSWLWVERVLGWWRGGVGVCEEMELWVGIKGLGCGLLEGGCEITLD